MKDSVLYYRKNVHKCENQIIHTCRQPEIVYPRLGVSVCLSVCVTQKRAINLARKSLIIIHYEHKQTTLFCQVFFLIMINNINEIKRTSHAAEELV